MVSPVNIGRGFDIDDFRSVMSKKGIARTNLYKLFITKPRSLDTKSLKMPDSPGDMEEIMLYCDSVTMPGLGLATTQNNPYGYGPMEQKAYAPLFNQLSASFIVDAKGYTLSYFRNWMRGIVNYTGGGKAYWKDGITTVRGGRNAPFEASYKAEYEASMELVVVSGTTNPSQSNENQINLEVVSKTRIFRAFPIMIGDVILSYGVTDQYMTLPVTFSYFDWYSDDLSQAYSQLSPNQTGSNPNEMNTPQVSGQTTTNPIQRS